MKKIISIVFILLLIILCISTYILIKLKENDNNSVEAEIIAEPKTVEEVLESYNTKYISEENNIIYVVFNKDLFNENGESNEKYFTDIIDDLKPFYKKESFSLIDEEKDINIDVQYDTTSEKYIIKINNKEDFYETVNGESYTKVDTSRIVEDSEIRIDNSYLETLLMRSMYFSEIEDELGDGTPLENGYTSYFDGIIKIRNVPTGAVRNIIFSDEYDGNITTKLRADMSLDEVYNINPDNSFGSVSDGYLGYKEADYYLFFYDDEVSVYSYAYRYNDIFEEALEKYLDDKNLEEFVNKLVKAWKAYDYYEYNPETQDAYILYSNRGIEINIKNNNPEGITLYSNYYFTDVTRKYVKDGLITFKYNEDLIDKTEKQRREGTLNFNTLNNE